MMRPLGVVIHLSASRFGDRDRIDSWHRARGWNGIGYHRVILNGVTEREYDISRDGIIQTGRPTDVQGAHCQANDMNRVSLGIVCIGLPGVVPSGAQKAPDGTTTADYLTIKQWYSLIHTLRVFCDRFRWDPEGFFIHPHTGARHPVITQHSDHDRGKPFCASLNMIAVRRAVNSRR